MQQKDEEEEGGGGKKVEGDRFRGIPPIMALPP